jgi:hypothetical protein
MLALRPRKAITIKPLPPLTDPPEVGIAEAGLLLFEEG